MPTDRESPNPFASPQTVSTGDAKSPPRELGPRLRDLKHQTIGFAVLTLTGLVALGVAIGLGWFVFEAEQNQQWDSFFVPMAGFLGILIGFAGAPLAIVCGMHTVASAAKFVLLWYIGRGPAREEDA